MPFYLGRKAIRRVPGAVIKAAPLPQPELIEGFGKRALVGELCKKAEYGSVLLVTDETLFSLGLHEKVMASLDAHRIPYTIFHDINGEPTVRMVDAGRRGGLHRGVRRRVHHGQQQDHRRRGQTSPRPHHPLSP